MKNVLLGLLFVGFNVASAASSYHVNLYRPTTVNGTELKAGECKVEIHDNKLTIKQGKVSAQTTVKLEQGAQKFISTTLGYAGDGSGSELQEIRLGGTNTKVVFEQPGVAAVSSK